jgi:hypothetical protein
MFQSKPIKEPAMRCHTSLALMATVSILTAVGSVYPAAAQDRYCLQGRQWGYPGNCQFSSYAQCMATASGTDSYCGVNPARAYARQPREGYRDRYDNGYRDRY